MDGFILLGQVFSIIGVQAYRFVPPDYGLACVVMGLEPLDISQGLLMFVEVVNSGEPKLENQYTRVVEEEGNSIAFKLLDEVFEPSLSNWLWHGL